jgi:Co/Zn/Cd efflux system component
MASCCNDKSCALDQLHSRQGATLKAALALNAAMFVVELVAGLKAGSVSLLADSLDMLGDALVYGFSLWVVGRGLLWKARAATAKAGVMAAFGLFVLGEIVYKLVAPQTPAFETMGAVGFLALAVNAVCFALLWRHRAEDINMRSVWLCSRDGRAGGVADGIALARPCRRHSDLRAVPAFGLASCLRSAAGTACRP